MELITSYRDDTRQGISILQYWNDAGVPVEIKVKYDPYPQQCYGAISRWTERNGYERVVTADPGRIHRSKTTLEEVAGDLMAAYLELTGRDKETMQ